MSSGVDREQQFDSILDAACGDSEALRDAARRLARYDTELSASVNLIAQLAAITPAHDERTAARLAVGQRLAHAILSGEGEETTPSRALRRLRLSEPESALPVKPMEIAEAASAAAMTVPEPALRGVTPSKRLAPRRMASRQRIFLGAVAAVVALLAFGAGISVASASSLPESPLYNVKRIEESVLLALPMDTTSHARALGDIAMRRLTEAQAEASAHRDTMALALLSQYNADMRQLIMLAASVNAQHGDSSSITGQIVRVLQAQQGIQRAASAHGDAAFAQALKDSALKVEASLKEQGVTLPNTNSSNNPAGGSGSGHGKPPSATQTPGPTPTPPGSSGSHGGGNGNGNGKGNGASAGG